MPFNGSGVYTPPAADFPVVTLTTVSSTKFNNTVNDISTAITNVVTRDGQSPWSANMPGGGFKILNMSAGTLRTDSTRPAEVQDGTYTWGATVGGTADAITFTLAPAITAYVAGQIYRYKSGAAGNTGAMTVAINGLTTKAIQKSGVALVAGDHPANSWFQIMYDGAAFQLLSHTADVVTRTSTSTLINKTLTAPVITSPKMTVQTLTAGATVAVDMSLGTAMTLTLGSNTNAIQNPTNLAVGQWGWIDIVQDGTGSRTCTWASNYKFVGGVAPVSAATGLSTAASAVDRAYWVCTDGTTVQCTWGKGFA